MTAGSDDPIPDPILRREIRSYVLRQGRMSPAQARAIETLLPLFGVPYPAARDAHDALLDLGALFGRSSPKVLEIGFGMGETTAAIAASMPDTDFVGVEVHAPGVGALLNRIEALALRNVRIIQHDAVAVVKDMIAADSLDGIHVFFPDPWPKKRHHKRRLIQPAFVSLLASRLKPGGYIHLATDWEDYALQMLEVLSAERTLVNAATDFSERPSYRPETKFERRGVKLGHGVWDVVFRRVPDR